MGPCNHVLCVPCGLKAWVLRKDKTCLVCKALMSSVIFTECKYLDFQVYDLDDFFRVAVNSPQAGIRFVTKKVSGWTQAVLSKVCPLSHCHDYDPEDDLQGHVYHFHDKVMCRLCIESGKFLPNEYETFTSLELTLHDFFCPTNDTGSRGHPGCSSCEQRFYDDAAA